jgi:hypothetical protein
MFIAPVPSQDAGNQPGNKQAEKLIHTVAAGKVGGVSRGRHCRGRWWRSRFDVRGESCILDLRAHGMWVRACAVLASAMLISTVLTLRECSHEASMRPGGRQTSLPNSGQ